jgi:hypothetical protein
VGGDGRQGADTDFELIVETASFLCYFSSLPDSRQVGKVVYPLDEVLLLSMLGVLAGAESFHRRFGEKKLKLSFCALCGREAATCWATSSQPWTPKRSSAASPRCQLQYA